MTPGEYLRHIVQQARLSPDGDAPRWDETDDRAFDFSGTPDFEWPARPKKSFSIGTQYDWLWETP